MITEHGWEPMTDKQALDILKSAKMFRSLLMEAMGHAVKALEEKVEKENKE